MKKMFLGVALMAGLTLIGAGCLSTPPQLVPITLNYWRSAEDPATAFGPVITDYQKAHPNINLVISTFKKDDYQKKLIEALAEDRGPDLFSVPSTALGAFKNKILPLPAKTSLVALENGVPKTLNQKSITIKDLINQYVAVVATTVVLPYKADPNSNAVPIPSILGLPLSVDSLEMLVNNDILKKAGLTTPAASWSTLQAQAVQMTTRDKNQNIIVSGAGLGTAKNVRYFSQIISALMMQNGAQIADKDGYATFDRSAQTTTGSQTPGLDALNFYVGFGAAQFGRATWSATLPDSLDAFVAGKSAYAFGFPEDAAAIQARGVKFNFSVAPLPQINAAKPVNLAEFPVEVVSKKTKYANAAWDFIEFMSSKNEVSQFLSVVKRPSALRSLVSDQFTDPDIGPSASQALTAKSWYKGDDYTLVDQAFAIIVNTLATATAQLDYRNIFTQAINLINSTVK